MTGNDGRVVPEKATIHSRVAIFGEDPSTRESLARALETEEYEVARVADCPAAIKLFAARTTALAIVDLGTDGAVATNQINWLARLNPALPLVILTSASEFPKLGSHLNLAVVLEKPVAIPKLLTIMEQLLERAEDARRRLVVTQLRQENRSYGGS